MHVLEKFKREVYLEEDAVWRYMDLSKFVDLLDSRCLFFPSVTTLRKLDPYEGSFIPFGSHDNKDEKPKRIPEQCDDGFSGTTFVNSWYLSDIESAALWRLFPKSDEGIAIRSTIKKLSQAIASGSGESTVNMGSVTYGHEKVRERKGDIPNSYSGDDAVFTKRACFEHEKELRLVIYTHDLEEPIVCDQNGLKVPVDIGSLISEVVISPEAPHWMKDLVERVLRRYDFSLSVRPSTLNELWS
jgi:hypothetical protein